MLFIWLPGERNPGPNGSVSTSSSVFFQFPFLMLLCLLDAWSYMRDKIASYRYLKGINMKEELAWVCTKKLWGVQWNSEEKQTIPKVSETILCTAFETNDSFSGPCDVKKTQKLKKTPQTVRMCIVVESILDHVHDFKQLWIWVQPGLFIDY